MPSDPDPEGVITSTINPLPKSMAVAIFALTVLLAISALALTVLTPANAPLPSHINGAQGLEDWVRSATGIAFAGVGALIVWQRGNLVGWLLLIAGLSYTASYESANRYVAYSIGVRPLPASAWAAWLAGWGWIPAFAILLTFLPLVYPTGRLVTRRWALALIGALLATAVLLFCTLVAANNPSDAFPQWRNPLGGGLTFVRSGNEPGPASGAYGVIAVLALAALASLIVRYRRSQAQERRQLQWFGAAVITTMVGWIAMQSLPQMVVGVVPLAVGIAVLRYHLYDLQLAVSKALLYGALVAFITVIYLIVVAGFGSLVGSDGRFGLVLGIVATALIAVAFQPVRDRLNRLANQVVFGLPSNPYAMLAAVGRSSASLDADLEHIAHAIAEGARANRVRVRLLLPDGRSRMGSWPAGAGGQLERTYPIRHGERLIGELEATGTADPGVMATLVGQAGLALSTLRLSAEVADRVDQLEAQAAELAASRARLVAAQEAERRRLERDLHDGVQQELVALIAKLRLARNQLHRDPQQASATLGELQSGIQRALEDLRELAHGIHPAVLGSRGLVEAVEGMAARMPIGIEVDADGALRDVRYAEEIEGAAYFVVAEGLTNVMKHAKATQAKVTISSPDSRLCVAVDDDGCGFVPDLHHATGLRGLRDRVEALGGRLVVTSRTDGTRVEASLPARKRVDV